MITFATCTLWAIGLDDFSNPVFKGLAVAGGAAVGALLTGWVGKVAVRLLTTRPMPVWAVRLLQLLGGVAAGWLIALWVFSGGGSGVGGPGGPGLGGGNESPPEQKKQPEGKGNETEPKKSVEPLRIEILGEDALKALGQTASGTYRGYRIEGSADGKLYTFEQILDLLRHEKQEHPKRKVFLVTYKDSPALDKQVVAQLAIWLEKRFTWQHDPKEEYSPEKKRLQP
jgi:hypothetical protein